MEGHKMKQKKNPKNFCHLIFAGERKSGEKKHYTGTVLHI